MAAVRGRWPLMLRTGWVVVRRMTRVSPSANSMARAAPETWTVTVCPAWERPRAAAVEHRTTECDLLAERNMILGGEPGAGLVTQAGGDLASSLGLCLDD